MNLFHTVLRMLGIHRQMGTTTALAGIAKQRSDVRIASENLRNADRANREHEVGAFFSLNASILHPDVGPPKALFFDTDAVGYLCETAINDITARETALKDSKAKLAELVQTTAKATEALRSYQNLCRDQGTEIRNMRMILGAAIISVGGELRISAPAIVRITEDHILTRRDDPTDSAIVFTLEAPSIEDANPLEEKGSV